MRDYDDPFDEEFDINDLDAISSIEPEDYTKLLLEEVITAIIKPENECGY